MNTPNGSVLWMVNLKKRFFSDIGSKEIRMGKAKNAVRVMESMMTGEQIERSSKAAERETLAIRLASLRTRRGIKQTDISAFSQTAVSKFERRKDMKLSTLIDYLDAIGMGLEIRVYPKNSNTKSETLLKI